MHHCKAGCAGIYCHGTQRGGVVRLQSTAKSEHTNVSPQDWLGRPFGSRVSARKGGGWVLLLAPSAELWTSCLRHRTQILYLADISMAVTFMELRPGCDALPHCAALCCAAASHGLHSALSTTSFPCIHALLCQPLYADTTGHRMMAQA